jgi:hypothetical protein
MHHIGHPVTITQCCLKVADITQFKAMSFTNGILGQRWVKSFKRHHFKLTFKKA